MSDIRLQRQADVLVNYSTEVQPGEWVGILGSVDFPGSAARGLRGGPRGRRLSLADYAR